MNGGKWRELTHGAKVETALCARCGHPEHAHTEPFSGGCSHRRNASTCRCSSFRPEERPECPNTSDLVLCTVRDGVFVPEAGCPRHDPNPEVSR